MGKRKSVLDLPKVLIRKPGSHATEETITSRVKRGGKTKYVVHPSIDPRRGISVTRKEGMKMERKSGTYQEFSTKEEAEKYAVQRSKAGGRDRKR